MKKLLLLTLFIFLMSGVVFPQSLGDNLRKVGPGYAALYLQPFVDAFGTNLNSNYFYSAYVPFDIKKPITPHLGLRIRFMNTFLSEADQKFNYSYAGTGFDGESVVSGTYRVENAPTVIGEKTEAVAKFYDNNGNYYPVNDKILIGGIAKTKFIPLAMPEIVFGSLYGTDASVSFLPSINLSNFGKFSFFGFSIRHNVSHYFPKSPVDIAVQGGYQIMSLTESNNNDLWKSNNFFVNGQVSKTFNFITGYAALQYEKFSTDISYIETDINRQTLLTIKGNNTFRGIIGASAKVGFFVFNVDANIGNRFALSAGLNFIVL